MEELRIKLAEVLNDSNLPFECKFYILKDLFNEVNLMYRDLLDQYKKEENKTQEEEISDTDKQEQSE